MIQGCIKIPIKYKLTSMADFLHCNPCDKRFKTFGMMIKRRNRVVCCISRPILPDEGASRLKIMIGAGIIRVTLLVSLRAAWGFIL